MSKREERLIDELISSALDKGDEDHARWDDIGTLQDRGGREVFAATARLISSGDGRERSLGVDILAQGHIAEKPMRDRAIPLLLDLAARERNPIVNAKNIYRGAFLPWSIGSLARHVGLNQSKGFPPRLSRVDAKRRAHWNPRVPLYHDAGHRLRTADAGEIGGGNWRLRTGPPPDRPRSSPGDREPADGSRHRV